MGSVKDFYDILADLYDRLSGQPRRKKLNLAENLGAIARLLDEAREKFEHKQIPRREAKELAILINFADKLLVAFKHESHELAELFDQQLPRIGQLMSQADFFIYEGSQYSLQPNFDILADPTSAYYRGEDVIRKVCEEMQRAAGTISAFSRKYQQEGTA